MQVDFVYEYNKNTNLQKKKDTILTIEALVDI